MTVRALTAVLPIAGMLVVLVGCGKEPGPTASAIRAEPLIVYADYEDEAYLPGLFAGFTEQTGIRVTVRHADAKTIVSDVINNRGSPPADVLLSPTLQDIWTAADEGALRLLGGDQILKRVPERLRDPDGFWTAVSYRTALIAFNPSSVDAASLTDYKSLSANQFRGKLCLSSSGLSLNRVLIAMLINEQGMRPTEIVVRGWMANLALPVFESEVDLLAAIAARTCAVALVSSDVARNAEPSSALKAVAPATAYADIEGVGIARHARQADIALQFIEWLVTADVQARHQQHTKNWPVNPLAVDNSRHTEGLSRRNVGAAAWQNEAALRLAERAGYR